MALQAAVVDCSLSTLNQTPSDTMGPMGRLQDLVNCVVKRYLPHYTGTQGVVPAKIRVEPRDGFVSLPATARSVLTGSPTTVAWNQQRLLAELDSQIVSICGGSVPRVFNGATWSTYVNNQILTQKLSEQVIHTSQKTIQASDSAKIGAVTCSVWTETTNTSTGPITTSYVGFLGDNGAWIVAPQVLGNGTAGKVTTAKVVADGANFWVFWSTPNTPTTVNPYVFDTHGAFLAGTAITLASGAGWPGPWDIVAAASTGGYTVQFATPANIGFAGDGVTFQSFGWNGTSIITSGATTDVTAHCSGQLAWLTNNLGNGLAYLATTKNVIDSDIHLWVYEVTNRAHTHEYDTGVVVNLDLTALYSLAGFSYLDGGGQVGIVLRYSLINSPTNPATSGPKYDPQRRFMSTVQVAHGGTITALRTDQATVQMSRAFEIDGDYYSIGYYQSGSGNAITETKQTVSITGGDYFIGAAIQPIPVQAGDFTQGSPIVAPSNGILGAQVGVSGSHIAVTPTGTDFVTSFLASGFGGVGIADGTPLLKWKVAGLGSTASFPGGQLVVSGSTVAQANGTWDIVAVPSTDDAVYTPITNVNKTNTVIPVGTFGGGGSISVASLTGYVVSDLSPFINSQTAHFFVGSPSSGAVTVAGSSHGNNVTGATIKRVYYGTGPNYFGGGAGPWGAVWVATGSQTPGIDTFTATISPVFPNGWSFQQALFDSTYVGTNLVVANDVGVPTNNNTYPITAVSGTTIATTGGATSVIAEAFSFPFPGISIQLTTQVAYTFHLQSLTLDYTYQNAIVVVQGADNPANDGTYTITQILDSHTFVATPTNGLSNQTNEALTGAQTITIFFASNNEPEFQSTWFIIPMTGNQPVSGCFERGLAYADWIIEGDPTYAPTLFPGALSSVYPNASGLQFVLPYRAQNVTSSVTQITAAGEVDIGDASFQSTAGLKQFWIEAASGHAYANSGELLIPGPMASVYTSSGFFEDNFNVAPEAPFLISQSTAAGGQLGITLGAIRIYVAVFEYTDENGNRIYSPPSPPLVVNMSGTNNVATIGGRLAFPLGTDGAPVASTFGPTTRNGTISLYATAFINGVPTTNRYKVTFDLSANGLAPISGTNPSGFSFPDSFTWNYLDQNPDSEIQNNEVLYTDKGYLPRFGAPAFTQGEPSWLNREFVIGYDGAIWFSGEKTEGDAIWFNPAFRIVLPTDDEPLGIAAMENYLIVTCHRSIWYIPAAQFPDATGQNGTIPEPVQLPFPNGSISGLAQTIREGVAYDSTAGGLWLITRNLDNVWLSHDVQDTLATPIIDLALDGQQRLFVLQQSGPIMVYDSVPAAWYAWAAPTAGVLLATSAGNAVYQDGATVNVVTPGQVNDSIAGVTTGIAPDITLAPLNLGNVRGLKRVWEFQAVGTYLGPHRVNVVLSYPEEIGIPNDVFGPFSPAGAPYVLPFNPTQEEAAQYGIRIYADFVGVGTPGLTFALEMVSAQVGLDAGVGLSKLPENVTLLAA